MNPELPQDPFMLLSFVNMKLRDQYATLDEFCQDLDVTQAQLDEVLNPAGFEYNEEQHKYW